MTTLLLSNLVYGDRYTDLYLDCHLPSVLDDSNLPAIKERVAIECYADGPSADRIQASLQWERLIVLGIPATIHRVPLPPNAHEQRYAIQTATFQRSLHRAIADSRALLYTSADCVYGVGVVPGLLAKLDQGHDAVLGVPMRGASESMYGPVKQYGKALTAQEQYELCRRSLHPLWMVSHWNAPDFSRLPYALLWSNATEILARPLTISSVVFKVNAAMLNAPATNPDACGQATFTNPYYIEEWSELPIIELQALNSFWPPFRPGPSNVGEYLEWTKIATPNRDSIQNLKRCFRYADPSTSANADLRAESDATVAEILGV